MVLFILLLTTVPVTLLAVEAAPVSGCVTCSSAIALLLNNRLYAGNVTASLLEKVRLT